MVSENFFSENCMSENFFADINVRKYEHPFSFPTLVSDTVVSDTVVPDTVVPDTVVSDTTVSDTNYATRAGSMMRQTSIGATATVATTTFFWQRKVRAVRHSVVW